MHDEQRRKYEREVFLSQMKASAEVIYVDVTCDDRQTKLAARSFETVAQIRRKALAEMSILTNRPETYLAIAVGGRKIDEGRTIGDLQAEGEKLAFRFIRPPVFGRHTGSN